MGSRKASTSLTISGPEDGKTAANLDPKVKPIKKKIHVELLETFLCIRQMLVESKMFGEKN